MVVFDLNVIHHIMVYYVKNRIIFMVKFFLIHPLYIYQDFQQYDLIHVLKFQFYSNHFQIKFFYLIYLNLFMFYILDKFFKIMSYFMKFY